MSGVRTTLRNLGLAFFAVLAAYTVSMLLAARAALLLMHTIAPPDSAWLGLLLGVTVDDLLKAPAIFVAAWLLARTTTPTPLWCAALLMVGVHGLDTVVTGLLHLDKLWVWSRPPVALCRLFVAGLVFWATTKTVTRTRRKHS